MDNYKKCNELIQNVHKVLVCHCRGCNTCIGFVNNKCDTGKIHVSNLEDSKYSTANLMSKFYKEKIDSK